MKTLIDLCRTKYTEEEICKIAEAIDLATSLHGDQKRDSGEPYITHPIEVAKILFNMSMDSSCVIAGILHDVVEDCDESLADIENRFGADTAVMVDGVTKLSQASESTLSREEKNAENIRKLFIAIARDPRVVIIKLADRLHNMRTLQFCKPEKQKRKAQETMNVYAPLADRFGMGLVKCELEDLCFQYLDPENYKLIKTTVEPQQKERMQMLGSVMDRINSELDKAGILGKVSGRPKHLYGIYRKMKSQHLSIDQIFDQIYDMTAVRVIVSSVADCYQVLGIVHNIWPCVPGRFKDYISTPKPNGYQSIHTTLFSDDKKHFEVQIRTMEMHNTAEFGLCAHWLYKQRSVMTDLDKKLEWVMEVLDYQNYAQDAQEFISDIQFDFFSEYVFAITPNGKIIDLPIGSTPVDFAYRIHSDIGNKTIGAKVNGAVVRLDYQLKTNDVVEIITGDVECPQKSWLDFVVTHQASAKIKQWLKKTDRAKDIEEGSALLDQTLAREQLKLSDFTDEQVQAVLDRYSMKSTDDLFAALGRGAISSIQIASKLTEVMHSAQADVQNQAEHEEKADTHEDDTEKDRFGISVKGKPNASVKLSRCCNPLPGDEIFGYMAKGGKCVSVHRADCANAKDLKKDTSRIVPVEWSGLGGSYTVVLELLTEERQGVLNDVSAVILKEDINLLFINAHTTVEQNSAHIRIAFETQDVDKLRHVISALRSVESVVAVYRVNG